MTAAPSVGAAPLDQEGTILDGKQIFLAQKCNLCHTVSSAGIEATTKSEKLKGPDLTVAMTEKMRDAEWINKFLRKKIELEGKKHAKEFKGSDEEIGALIAWLQKQKKNQ
jgi:mono/diheme cytochrome c family protein